MYRDVSNRAKETAAANQPLAEGIPLSSDADRTPFITVDDFEHAAKRVLRPEVWDYLSGGAGDEITLRWNREDFDRIKVRPRVLVDVSHIDTRLTLWGCEIPSPILLAPTGYHRLFHPEGELETARGASAANSLWVVSSFATVAIEEVSAKCTSSLWFQLYVQQDRGFTAELVERVEQAGCRALVVTVDTPVLGSRSRELRSGWALPPGIERVHLRGLGSDAATASHRPHEQEIYSAVLDASLSWKDIDWLRSMTRLPILLKGILSSQDAAQAVSAGVDGIIVSNHGARNLDTVPSTIHALPEVIEAIAGRLPVLFDGGVRRGTDVLKALAHGASAVFIGRPYLFGLSVAGAEGVAHVTRLLQSELRMAMALTGRTQLSQIDRSLLWP
ncbi:MAG: alpha-hydroxy-acid oxidizing protein [Planctomycetes bacterium]|nr:alpha-hydroxy-acid oxidizing protein [Planctomycetota bacterium]MBI3834517.1 alpha-hydroxy-acid oxidizing protein [Planctomycetota bacterium]